MRSGLPDSLDLLVAKNFGNLAADLVVAGKTGLMVAVVGGRYTAVSVDRLGDGIRRVNVDRFYDSEEYRPKITSVMNLPMFLH
jgi:6-phosphofructokinase 1